MEDMDEARTAGGTAADFSAWDVNNKFGKMKLSSKEKVIEPEPTEKEPEPTEKEPEPTEKEPERVVSKTKQIAERLKELEEEKARLKAEEEAEKEKEAKRQRPGTNSFNINIKALGEIKELAKKLLPKIHEVKQDEYAIASELAINLAMTFEGVWEQKIGGIDVKETE